MHSISTLLVALLMSTTIAAQKISSDHARKTLELYTSLIETDTSKEMGNTPKVARYLADELITAGFPEEDVEVVLMGNLAALVAKYRGNRSSGKAPILLLGHMDVVEAKATDWKRPPFKLTSDDKYFYARGSMDNKFGIAQLTSTFIRLKKEGFVPNRDLILAFSGITAGSRTAPARSPMHQVGWSSSCSRHRRHRDRHRSPRRRISKTTSHRPRHPS